MKTFAEISAERTALIDAISASIRELDKVQIRYDTAYVAHLRATGEDGLMNANQIALYSGLTSGRVQNIWSNKLMRLVKDEGERKSKRSDVDVYLKNRWVRDK